MPFDHGTFAVSIFALSEKLPEDYLAKFEGIKAGVLDAVKDEPQVGWVSGRHLLETTIDEVTALCGGHLYLNLRTAERKIPSSLLNAICRREELAYMQANETSMVPFKQKKMIKEEAIEKNLMKMPPSISGTPMVIDMASKMLYLGTGSSAQIDNFIAHFYKTLNIEPIQVTPAWILEKRFEMTEVSLPTVMFSENCDDEMTPGRDFLTWLWYYSECDEGAITVEQYGEFVFVIEAPLTFAFSAEARGAGETTLKKGDSPLRAAEAKAALTVGKKLKKSKFILARGADTWSGTFDADTFTFSGMTLPEGEEMDRDSRFAERIDNLHIFQTVFREYFALFVKTVTAPNWSEVEEKIQRWSAERDSR
ncbi:MAG: recombination-associated protein RdgC [Victivallaceae bacterium]|nr:recombination-associated protein RdgC [Victivallaceae bacterium]MDD4180364.1 recombination-associated protein RdgC [Victivallaceae bacterium]